MKITINKSAAAKETEITVLCSELTPELEEIISHITLIDNTVTGKGTGKHILFH